MQIHILRGQEQLGPYSVEQVNQWLTDGNLVPADLAWSEGQPNWIPLSTLLGLDPAMSECAPVAESQMSRVISPP
ncbi:MAG: DUF4339 domain-containing protein [Verrucomicrobia bacterium]|nr:DUF4339 domain-containing protein [Verrucomicrobiota bacterium]